MAKKVNFTILITVADDNSDVAQMKEIVCKKQKTLSRKGRYCRLTAFSPSFPALFWGKKVPSKRS